MPEWRVRWSHGALEDLLAIVAFIATESPENVARILQRLRACADSLDRFPRRGRRLAELPPEQDREYRELIEAPWRIIYWIKQLQVQVIAVVDSRRDFVGWLVRSRRVTKQP